MCEGEVRESWGWDNRAVDSLRLVKVGLHDVSKVVTGEFGFFAELREELLVILNGFAKSSKD